MDRLKIVVCDDEIVQQKLMKALLEKYLLENEMQAELKFYPSGQSCLQNGRETLDADIFLLDIFMPELNGIDIAREQTGRLFSLPVEMIILQRHLKFMLFPIFKSR